MSAMKSAYEAGLRPAMHSDSPVAPIDPLFNMRAAVNRKASSGRVVGAGQAITPEQALATYTINPAYQFGMETDAGSLEVGKFADFVVLDSNPMKVDPDAIRNIQIVATVMGVRTIYSNTPLYDRVALSNELITVTNTSNSRAAANENFNGDDRSRMMIVHIAKCSTCNASSMAALGSNQKFRT